VFENGQQNYEMDVSNVSNTLFKLLESLDPLEFSATTIKSTTIRSS